MVQTTRVYTANLTMIKEFGTKQRRNKQRHLMQHEVPKRGQCLLLVAKLVRTALVLLSEAFEGPILHVCANTKHFESLQPTHLSNGPNTKGSKSLTH